MKYSGFTLIEICVIMGIVALITALTLVSLNGVHQKARGDQVGELIKNFDVKGRRWAKTRGESIDFVFDLQDMTLRFEMRGIERKDLPFEPIRLPHGFSLTSVNTPFGNSDISNVRIRCSAMGTTPTYVVSLSNSNGKACDLIFAGLTGDMYEASDLHHTQEIFQQLRKSGIDSH